MMLWPWNRGQRSLNVIDSGNIPSIVYGFLLVFLSNFVPKMHHFEIFDFKNAVTLKPGLGVCQGHLKYHFDRAHTTSYWRSIVTMALSLVVSEIFNVEKCCDLEIGVKGHSRSSKVVPFDRLCMVSYWCSLVTLSLKRDIRLVSIQWPWNPG